MTEIAAARVIASLGFPADQAIRRTSANTLALISAHSATKAPTLGVAPVVPVVVTVPVPVSGVVVPAVVPVAVVAANGLKAVMMVITVVMKLVPVAGVTELVVMGVVVIGVVVIGVVVMGVVVMGVVVIGVAVIGVVVIGVAVVAGKAAVVVVGLTIGVLTVASVVGVVARLDVLTVGAAPVAEATGTDVPPMTMHIVPSKDKTKPGGQIPSDTTRFTWTPVWAKAEADAKPNAEMADAAATRAVIRERVERMMISSIDECSSDPPIDTEFCPFPTKRAIGGNPRSTHRSTLRPSFGTLHLLRPIIGLSRKGTMVGN